jgi:FMN phosphatase YigB (HAD superfamily)
MSFNKTKIVVFDAYGTLVEIKNKKRPFIGLNKYLMEHNADYQGFNEFFSPLTQPLGLKDLLLKTNLKDESLLHFYENELKAEIDSIHPYPESVSVLNMLKNLNYHIVICSNLALPYADPIIKIFGKLVDHYVWSFNAHYMKPQKGIYQTVEDCFSPHLSQHKEHFLMVGDTYECDVKAPMEFGWNAIYLNRSGIKNKQEIETLSEIIPLLTK